jgi:fermentation-respiration switch protein FrsA (DUF1100 family)
MTEKGTVFFPDEYLVGTPQEYGLEYDDVFFPATDGTRLNGWFVKGTEQGVVLLWFHGNAGNISHRLDNLRLLHDALQIPIFIFDYREYGLSEGEISKKGTLSDAHGAYEYLTEIRGFKGSSVLLFGRSLGTALAVEVAAKRDCLGVVLEAAFTSTDEMKKLYFPFETSHGEGVQRYDSLSLIDQLRSPILFIHGQRDWTIPISMARKLFEKARPPKFFYEVEGADHNDTYLSGGAPYFKVWQNFLRNCLLPRL